MKFDDLKLRTKTVIPLIGMAAVFACVIGGGTLRMNDLTRRYGHITTSVDPAIVQLMRSTRTANELGRNVYAMLIYDPADPRAKKVAANFATAQTRGDKSFDEAARLNPDAADQYRLFKDRFDHLYEEAKAAKDLGKTAPTGGVMAQLDVDIDAFCKPVLDFNHALEAEDEKAVEILRRESEQTIAMMIGLGLLSVVGGLAVSIWIANGKVAAPLVRLGQRMERLAAGELAAEVEGQARGDEVGDMARAVQVFKDNALKSQAMEAEAQDLRDQAEAQRQATDRERAARAAELAGVVEVLAGGLQTLADGILTHRLNTAFSDDYEPLRQDFNAAMAKVETALSAVVSSASGINTGADEISQAADDLSRRTERQAASLEETAAALDQITATVRRTAAGAQHARAVVGKATTDAQASGQIVDGAVKAMSAIEHSSSEISQIISVIDEIAFQTNLLALNAGVEAARAGEAGRGFAVVAQEVRALAQRSADAAREIKTLISTSAKEVGHGVELVGQAGAALQRIAQQVAEINAIVEEITHSTQEQATGLAEVNTAINQMDQMTQQNAAMVEQSTAASHNLAMEAEILDKLTLGFQVGAPGAGARPAQAARGRVKGLARAS